MATRAAIGVQHFVQRGLPLLVLIALVSVAPGRAEDKPPAWRANASEVARLGEAFKDEAISIRLPKGFAPLANKPGSGCWLCSRKGNWRWANWPRRWARASRA